MPSLDLADILCEEQRVRVRFEKDSLWAESLCFDGEPRSSMTEGTIIQVPLWLARQLVEAEIVAILPMRQYGPRLRADLLADAKAVNLPDLCPYWYELGLKIGAMMPRENISKVLQLALSERIPLLARSVHLPSRDCSDPHKSIFGGPGSASKLDHTEQKIYNDTFAAKKDVVAWCARENTTIKPLDLYCE